VYVSRDAWMHGCMDDDMHDMHDCMDECDEARRIFVVELPFSI
jgi:hypothetical protein